MVMSVPSVMTLYEYHNEDDIDDDDDLDGGSTSASMYLCKMRPTINRPNPANAIINVQTASMAASMRRTASDSSSSIHAITAAVWMRHVSLMAVSYI